MIVKLKPTPPDSGEQGLGITASAFLAALDAAWIDGYSIGADPVWCARALRRMGHGGMPQHTDEAAVLLLSCCAAHRPALFAPPDASAKESAGHTSPLGGA